MYCIHVKKYKAICGGRFAREAEVMKALTFMYIVFGFTVDAIIK